MCHNINKTLIEFKFTIKQNPKVSDLKATVKVTVDNIEFILNFNTKVFFTVLKNRILHLNTFQCKPFTLHSSQSLSILICKIIRNCVNCSI